MKVFAVVIYYPHVDFPEIDTLWEDEDDAIQRATFIEKYSRGAVFLQEMRVQ